MTNPRSSIPTDVKRQLRQESGFGCCHCGHPFIQYHHIIPWAVEEHNRPEDMMTLCGQCHPLCTVEAVTEAQQRKWKSRPKNIVDNQLKGTLWVTTNELRVRLAGGLAIDTPKLIELSGTPVLEARLDADDGRVLISANIHSSTGQLIGKIQNNEWVMTPDSIWDFEAFPRHATIRHGPGDIAFAVDTRGEEVELRGKWFQNNQKFEFSPTEAILGNNKWIGNIAIRCDCMFSIM